MIDSYLTELPSAFNLVHPLTSNLLLCRPSPAAYKKFKSRAVNVVYSRRQIKQTGDYQSGYIRGEQCEKTALE